jgi:hypothetical protein
MNEMMQHPGTWLFEEGMAYSTGSDFKKMDPERGQLMIASSASAGFPLALAFCIYVGGGKNGLADGKNFKSAFEQFVKIKNDTKGYHWAQFYMSVCYDHGYGVGEDKA